MEKTLTMSKKKELERLLRESQKQWNSERKSFRQKTLVSNMASQRSKSDFSRIPLEEEGEGGSQ